MLPKRALEVGTELVEAEKALPAVVYAWECS